MKKLFAGMFLLSILSACSASIDPGHTSVHVPGASIHVDDDHHGGGFCPPGQAKKGRC